jgi:hypothetical protein
MLRVLVTGSRDWPDPIDVSTALDEAWACSGGFMVLVHGDCPTGADSQAESWAVWMRSHGYLVKSDHHPADWKQFKKRAGFIRNAEMVKLGADRCLAFIYNESNGATHTRDLAKKAGIPTETFIKGTSMGNAIDRTPVLKPRPYRRVNDELTLRDIRIIYKNFAGRGGKFNAEGKRNFGIPLEEAQAIALHEAGWAVKERIKESGDHMYHLPVTVKMDGRRPPKIFLITMSENRRAQMTEENTFLVDDLEFDRIDVTLRPFNYDVNGNLGVAAYLKIFMGALHEDELELEYAHIPIDGQDAPRALELERAIDAQVEHDSGWIQDEEDDFKAIEAAQKALDE